MWHPLLPTEGTPSFVDKNLLLCYNEREGYIPLFALSSFLKKWRRRVWKEIFLSKNAKIYLQIENVDWTWKRNWFWCGRRCNFASAFLFTAITSCSVLPRWHRRRRRAALTSISAAWIIRLTWPILLSRPNKWKEAVTFRQKRTKGASFDKNGASLVHSCAI